MASKHQTDIEPTFSRSDVARILNVTPLTIANREKKAKYPPAKRDINQYRYYTLNDVLNLQLITFSVVDPRPIISLLYDKGYRNIKQVSQMIDTAMDRKKGMV